MRDIGPPGLTTDEIAAAAGIRPESIRHALSVRGHYYGLVPRKRPNGRLEWPADGRNRLRASDRQLAAIAATGATTPSASGDEAELPRPTR